jgi:DNA-directed RNA polymerase subunit RPC12/RpoP
MVIEHRIIVGLDDVKAISLKCLKCHTKVTFEADSKVDVPLSCGHCGNPWRSEQAQRGAWASDSAVLSFVQVIPTIRAFLAERVHGFNVLLEFEEPKDKIWE